MNSRADKMLPSGARGVEDVAPVIFRLVTCCLISEPRESTIRRLLLAGQKRNNHEIDVPKMFVFQDLERELQWSPEKDLE